MDQRDRVAGLVDHGDVDRVAGQAAVGGNAVPRQGAVGIHQRAPFVGIGLGDQPFHRHVGEARVGEMAVAVVIGDLLGLHHEMHRVGPEERLFVQLEGLQQVQHLEHGEALGRRRRLVDRHVAIAALDRLAPARRLRLEVVQREEAVVGVGVAHQLARHLAVVEAVPAVAGDGLQRAREIRVLEDLVVLEEDRRRFRTLGQIIPRRRQPMREARRHRKAVAREADGAFQAALQRQAAVGGVRHAPARDGAGHGERAGQRTAIGHFVEAAPREGLDRAARGRAAAAVDVAHGVGRGVVDQPEGVAADAGHVGIEDGERGTRRDRRIDGRAAVAQHRRRRLALASACGLVTMPFGERAAGRPALNSIMMVW